jgi:hypothetical protein
VLDRLRERLPGRHLLFLDLLFNQALLLALDRYLAGQNSKDFGEEAPGQGDRKRIGHKGQPLTDGAWLKDCPGSAQFDQPGTEKERKQKAYPRPKAKMAGYELAQLGVTRLPERSGIFEKTTLDDDVGYLVVDCPEQGQAEKLSGDLHRRLTSVVIDALRAFPVPGAE